MADEFTMLETPIDVMQLIYKALHVEATRAEELANQLEIGGSLQGFRLAFNSWVAALIYFIEQEDIYIADPLANAQPSGQDKPENIIKIAKIAGSALNSEHQELMEAVQEVFTVLNEDIGRTSLIARTKQHLYGRVVTLRIAQEDHTETEEALVLPVVRKIMDEQRQLETAKGFLIDEQAENSRWFIDWMTKDLDSGEQSLLADLEARFGTMTS